MKLILKEGEDKSNNINIKKNQNLNNGKVFLMKNDNILNSNSDNIYDSIYGVLFGGLTVAAIIYCCGGGVFNRKNDKNLEYESLL